MRSPILHAANAGTASRFDQARAVFAGVGADPEQVRRSTPPRSRARPAVRSSRRCRWRNPSAGLTPLRPWRDALNAVNRCGCRRRPDNLNAVNDEQALTVVTVALLVGFTPGSVPVPLTVATDRPLKVIIADNGSTDGAPRRRSSAIRGPPCCVPAATSATALPSTVGGHRSSR